MATLLYNVRLVQDGCITPVSILMEDGKVRELLPASARVEGAALIDGGGVYAAPGFIDIHTHGAGGHDFMDGTVEAYVGACKTHLQHGTTTIFPTTLSASYEEIVASIASFKEAKERLKDEMCLSGMHLEGPYFAMNQKGGQDPRYIRDPRPEEYIKVVEAGKDAIARWSIAPELPGAMEMGDYLVANGILPALGHTDATYEDCVEGLKHGYTHVTHLYSCTSTITRKSGFRVLGVTESAYCLDELTVELIADGCHLPPELLRMIVKCKGVDKISLITDSLRPAGLNVTSSISGSLESGTVCIIEDGVAKLPDRSAFAGSIATADRLLQTMWKKAGLPLTDTVQMMTANPAKVMGIEKTKGKLLPGMDADAVLFDEDAKVLSVFYGGRKVV